MTFPMRTKSATQKRSVTSACCESPPPTGVEQAGWLLDARPRRFPDVFVSARFSTTRVFVSLVEHADVVAELSDGLRSTVSLPLSLIGAASGCSPTTVRRSLGYLERRNLVERVGRGQGKKTHLRVLWSFNGPIRREPERTASSIEILLSRWSARIEDSDSRKIEVCLRREMNPATGRPYSSSTVNGALHYAMDTGFFCRYSGRQRGGRGRGSRFTFAPPSVAHWWKHEGRGLRRQPKKVFDAPDARKVQTGTATRPPALDQLRPCTMRQNPKPNNQTAKGTSCPETTRSFSTLRACSERGCAPLHSPHNPLPSGSQSTASLVDWLRNADLNREPTHPEKCKLSAGVRRIARPDVADAILDALWWRVHAPLRLWSDAIDALRRSPPPPSGSNRIWWARQLLKQLSATPPSEAVKPNLRVDLDADRDEPKVDETSLGWETNTGNHVLAGGDDDV